MHTWKWKGKSHLQPEQNPKAYQRNDGIHTCYNRATDGIGAVEKCTGKDCRERERERGQPDLGERDRQCEAEMKQN